MAYNLVVKPIVFYDTEEAVQYYEAKLSGLGKRFYNQLIQAFNEIETSPLNYSLVTGDVRRHRVKSFPYKVFYLVNENTITIIGGAHAKRSNAYVRRRLKK